MITSELKLCCSLHCASSGFQCAKVLTSRQTTLCLEPRNP